jgi:hypothetical protein
MDDFVSFLSDQGITGIEDLTCFVDKFLDDPSIFNELNQFERKEMESKMDEALDTFKNLET